MRGLPPTSPPTPDFSPSQAFHLSRPILGSLSALGALLLVGASPLSGVYLLESAVLTRVGPGRDRWDEGGVGVWGGCLRDGGGFLSQSCSLSLPFRVLTSSASPSPASSSNQPLLPSLPSLLPPILSLALSLALMTAFTAALASHVVNSWILWGSLSELGRPEGSVTPHTPAGRLRFGEGRWRRKWRERVRRIGLVGVGSCALACAIVLYPLLPSVYIPSPISTPAAYVSGSNGSGVPLARPTPALADEIPVSLLLTPSWGLLLLATAGALMLHSKDGRHGLRHGRRGSSLLLGVSGGGGGSGREPSGKSGVRGSSVDFNLPKSSSPLSSPIRSSPPRSPTSPHVLSPTPRRASLVSAAPWLSSGPGGGGGGGGGRMTAEAEDMAERGGDGGADEALESEGEDDEREVWLWSKEV